MAPLRSLMDLFQRATSLWRRGQWSFVRSVFTWPQRAANRETLLGFLGFGTASPEEEARGLKLLQENLSPAQREQHGRFGYFDVVGGNTGKRYRIKYGFQLNVALLDNRGRTKAVLCFAFIAAYVEEFEENDRKIAEGAWATALDLSRITFWYPILMTYCRNHPLTQNLQWERENMKRRKDQADFFFFDWD